MTVVDALEATVSRHPEQTAIVQADRRVSYAELAASSARLARGLIAMGQGDGTHVALLLSHTPEWLVSFFGVLKAGATPVIPNPLLTAPELRQVLDDSHSALVLWEKRFSRSLGSDLSGLPGIRRIVEVDGDSFQTMVWGAPGSGPTPRAQADETAAIVYALGALGKHKGIMHSHRSLMEAADVLASAVDQTEQDVLLDPIPFFYLLGLCIGALAPILRGSTTVLLPRFTPAAVAEAAASEGATLMVGVPAMYEALLGLAGSETGAKLTGLRAAFTGGARTPESLPSNLERSFGTVLCDVYGLSEHLLVSASSLRHRKPGTAGKPVCELKVLGDDGTEVQAGHIGEAVVRGPWTMQGYYNAPELTSQILRDSWLYTGDLVRLDGDGYLEYIKKRSSIIVTSAGTKIQPTEVEATLLKHPAVAEVAYLGIEADDGEVVPTAYVVPRRDQWVTRRELRTFCRGKVAGYKLPRRIEIADTLPKTT